MRIVLETSCIRPFADTLSWAFSLANESRHRDRELLLYDMYQSEAQYIMDLVIARDAYLNPLRKQIPAQTSHGLLSGRIVCTDHELRLLFNNIEQLLELHQDYLAKLESRCVCMAHKQLFHDSMHKLTYPLGVFQISNLGPYSTDK